MRTFSVSEAAKLLEVDRRTLQRWAGKGKIPVPTPRIVAGRFEKSWTEDEMDRVRAYKSMHYYGKGIDRRTGKKAKGTKR